MNVRAMQKGVQQQLSAMDIPLISEDIIYYLNRAQEKYIDEQYIFLRGKYTDNGNIELYQNSQKAIENLRTLVTQEMVADTDITSATQFTNAMKFDISDLSGNFYYYIRSQTLLSDGGEWVNNKLIEQENVQKFIKTKYNSPVFRDYLVLMEGSTVYIFYDDQDGAGVHDVSFTYLQTPGELVITPDQIDDGAGGTIADPSQTTESDLPKHTHKDVVNIAVELIVKDQQMTGNPRLNEMNREGN